MSTSTYDVLNPATEEVIETVPLATLADTDRAIEKAAVAFETWRHVSPADRAMLLRRFAAAETGIGSAPAMRRMISFSSSRDG